MFKKIVLVVVLAVMVQSTDGNCADNQANLVPPKNVQETVLKKYAVPALLVGGGLAIAAVYYYGPLFTAWLRRYDFHKAVKKGNLAVVKYLIENGLADINDKIVSNDWYDSGLGVEFVKGSWDNEVAYAPRECTALHLAVIKNRPKVVKYLIEHGATVNALDKFGCTPLHYAISHGLFRTARYLIEHGANSIRKKGGLAYYDSKRKEHPFSSSFSAYNTLRAYLSYYYTNNFYTNRQGACSLDLVKWFVAKGADVSENGGDVLELAGKIGDIEIFKYLYEQIEKIINVNEKDEAGCTLFHRVIRATKNIDIVEYLIGKGFDINAKNSAGDTALHIAVSANNGLKVVKYLVGKGLDVKKKNYAGDTVLHVAVFKNNLDVVEYLIKQGVGINEKNKNRKETALHRAVKRKGFGTQEIVRYLVTHGADTNAKDCSGSNALLIFLYGMRADDYWGYYYVIKNLVENGVNVNEKDLEGDVALCLASDEGSLDAVKYLVENGADVHLQNGKNMTALQIAINRKYPEIVAYLMLAADFEAVRNGNMAFNDFVNKYFAISDQERAAKNKVVVRDLLHLASQQIADKFYAWFVKNNVFKDGDKWAKGKPWMYFDLYKDACNASPKKLFWYSLTLDSLGYADENSAMKLKNAVIRERDVPDNTKLKKDYADMMRKKQLHSLGSETKNMFKPTELKDIKIKFENNKKF